MRSGNAAGPRVGIDLTALLPHRTGVDVALLGLVRHLAELPGQAYTVFVNAEDRRLLAGMLPEHVAVVPLALRPRPARLLFQQVLLPLAAAARRLDVVHSPSFIMPLWRGRARHILTIHDLTFFSLPDTHVALRRSAPFLRAVEASIRRADIVTVPTAAVAAALHARLPEVPAERVRVVGWGLDPSFRVLPAATVGATTARLGLPSRYVLFVGTVQPRKNLSTLVAAHRALVAAGDVAEDLVLAGPLGWGYDRVLAELARPELRGRVHQLGYVAQEDLPAVYAGATLLAYPSLDEGFGFPPLEAMACGVPVVASDIPALRETLADAALLVEPTDVVGLTAAIRRLAADAALRETYRARGLDRVRAFRWERTAHAMHGCYAELAARARRS
jgi:glycosyltransferase involved in cell wall biosynthesis